MDWAGERWERGNVTEKCKEGIEEDNGGRERILRAVFTPRTVYLFSLSVPIILIMGPCP